MLGQQQVKYGSRKLFKEVRKLFYTVPIQKKNTKTMEETKYYFNP